MYRVALIIEIFVAVPEDGMEWLDKTGKPPKPIDHDTNKDSFITFVIPHHNYLNDLSDFNRKWQFKPSRFYPEYRN